MPTSQKNILAISGSLRSGSANTTLLRSLATLMPHDVQYELYEGLDQLPFFNPDIDDATSLKKVNELRAQLKWADGVIICTPEYAFGVPGVLKNALDWLVSSGEFSNKPTATISASPLVTGGDKAHASLMQTIKVMGGRIPNGASLTIPTILKKLDENGMIANNDLAEDLSNLVDSLVVAINNPVAIES